MKRTLIFLKIFVALSALYAQEPLTVEKIMRDPKWIGSQPQNIRWSPDSKTVYFLWNPEKATSDSLYAVSLQGSPRKVTREIRRSLPPGDVLFNKSGNSIVYERDGDIFLWDLGKASPVQITRTLSIEHSPTFSLDEKKIFYTSEQNVFSWEVATGAVAQLTDFKKGKKGDASLSEQEKWLKQDQLARLQVLRERSEKDKEQERNRQREKPWRPKPIFIDDKNVSMMSVSPSEKYVVYRLTKAARGKRTIVPNYVTESGFTEDINARTKVGAPGGTQELFVYDIAQDTVYQVSTKELPGITDKVSFENGNAQTKPEGQKDARPEYQDVNFFQVKWSPDGKRAALAIRSEDNKNRWIALLDPSTGKLSALDRLKDEAWVSFSTGWSFNDPSSGWMDNNHVWFLSEETGYSHLYTLDIASGQKKALTSGRYEVQQVDLPRSRRYFYVITNEVHPGEKHLYRVSTEGGKTERMTTMTGAHEVELSPDEKSIAFRYSYSNKPWELFIMENKPGAKPRQITTSLTDEFKAYPWRDPEVVTFKARDSADVYARIYKPASPNGAAVVFVHGAGYLQNAHKWWSSYFREYMFHNLLADKGYTVLDIDYRASAGYGRDWRTGIYRFMGGKDLEDHVDGAKYLVEQHGIDANRIGIYGGSYGGFITLMALFTTPDVFAAGAALRPVTDWAHYNHGYTSNILNTPTMDSLSYAKSSPIYYAEGLKKPLLICHGMVDVNVHFQDVVRLSQRLIELGKDNWELAVYPMEDHGFVEPSSWTDEYKRILKLFETHLSSRED